MAQMSAPRFTIVTPCFNAEKHIRETIESVLSQEGDFFVEYRVVDGGSTDSTLKILYDYQIRFSTGSYPIRCHGIDFRVTSEMDQGMYDAIRKGFSEATGDIMAYINGDDIYQPGSFRIIAQALSQFPEVQWLKGITSYINEDSVQTSAGRCFVYNRDWIKRGIYGREGPFIQQDSCFWKAKIWKQSGGINPSLRLAGDYDLWIRFAQFAPLVSLNWGVSSFRRVPGQLSEDRNGYLKECKNIEPGRGLDRKMISLYFKFASRFQNQAAWLYEHYWGRHQLQVIEARQGVSNEPEMRMKEHLGFVYP